jgi:hypothetical protein
MILSYYSWTWNHRIFIGDWTTELLFLEFLFNLPTPVIIIITYFFVYPSIVLLFCSDSLSTRPYSSFILLLIVCFIKLLQRCYDCPLLLHSNLSLLSGLFLKIYCPTQVHTFVSKRVSSHSFLEIAMKFNSCFFDCWRWPSYNEGSSLLFCKFPFSYLFYCIHCYCCFYSLLVLLFLPFYFLNIFCHLPIHCLSLHNGQVLFWNHNMIMQIIRFSSIGPSYKEMS